MGYIYLGKYFHRAGKELNLSEKKIGKTINLDQREHELGRTNSPIGYTYINAWKTGDDTDKVERQIHALLGHDRMEGNEWFEDKADDLNDRLSTFMDYGNYKQVELADEEDVGANETRKVSRDKLKENGLKEKINEYLVGESFSFTRPNDFVQTITIKENGIYSSTNDKMYDIGRVHFAFADSFRQKLIEDGKITKEEWNWSKVRREHRGPTVNFWHNAKNKDGKTIMQRLLEVDKEKKQGEKL